jgi:hypothetical protein
MLALAATQAPGVALSVGRLSPGCDRHHRLFNDSLDPEGNKLSGAVAAEGNDASTVKVIAALPEQVVPRP